MNKYGKSSAIFMALAALPLAACNHSPSAAEIASTIKANEAQIIAAYNAHNTKGTEFDAPDGVWMWHGTPNSVGKAADVANTRQLFAADPKTHWAATDEHVDVSSSGDMAVYRTIYVVSFVDPKTKAEVNERGNYLQGWKRGPDGSWKLTWVIGADLPAGPNGTTPGG
jgi:ketosteroid isomerase-like protein